MTSLAVSNVSVEKIALTQGKTISLVCRLHAGDVLNVGVVGGGLFARVLQHYAVELAILSVK